ncbi:uncharacterized protein [Ptychodera flava]|uniref:uncharacterized protein n=1 Tax=Ptychodera flava TaxID=63121 RepID=UPI00396A8DA7
MAKIHPRNVIGKLIQNAVRKETGVRRLTTTSRANTDMRSDKLELKYEVLSQKRITDAAWFITKELQTHNPMVRLLGIPEDIHFRRNKAQLEKVAQNGFSAIIIDTSTDKVIGVGTALLVSNLDQFEYFVDPTRCDEFKPIRLLASKLAEVFFNIEEVKNLQAKGYPFLFIDTGVISERIRGTGIMTHFGHWTLEAAWSRGAKIAFARPNNTYGLKLHKRLGFEEVEQITFKEFDINGFKPFKDAQGDPESAGSTLVIRRLKPDH